MSDIEFIKWIVCILLIIVTFNTVLLAIVINVLKDKEINYDYKDLFREND